MRLSNSIHGRLRNTYIGMATIPLLVMGLVLTWTTYAAQRAQVLDLQQEFAQRVGTEVGDYIRSLESEMRVTARVTGLASRTHVDQEDILRRLQAEVKAFAELSLLDRQGMETVKFSYNEIIQPGDYQDRSNDLEFTSLKNNPKASVYYGQVEIATTGEPLMTIAIPLINNRDGTLISVLVAQVRFKEIWELIAREDANAGENIYIVDQQDRVVAHGNPSVVLRTTHFIPPQVKSRYTGLDRYPVLMGVDRQSFGDQVFTVVAETPVSRVLGLAFSSWILILGLVTLTVGIASAVALIATGHITRPVEALVRIADAIRQGDLSQRAAPSGLRELDILANTFNRMTSELRLTLESLEQRVADRTQALKTSAEVSRSLSTILDTEKLVSEVAVRVQSAFSYYHVNIYLLDPKKQDLVLVAGTGEAGRAMLADYHRADQGQVPVGKAAATNQPVLISDVTQDPKWSSNPQLPDTKSELSVPIARGEQVLGVLDVHHQLVGGLKQEDVDLMVSIANQLAVAFLNAQSFEQLVNEKLLEAQQKAEAEKQLEVYIRSPAGQAKLFAGQLLAQPEGALLELYQLAQAAGQDPEAASLLSHLPKYFEDTSRNGSDEDPQEVVSLARIAEGFNYLFSSHNVPELLLPGLRALVNELESPDTAQWEGSAQALAVYRLCQAALEASSIPQITQLEKSIPESAGASASPFADLNQSLAELKGVIDALIAYERVITLQDKLTYLVSAVERLRHIERQAKTRLASADLNVVLRITEIWQAIMAGALSELQTQAKINCRLLTRHTWHDDLISLVLSLRNEGRGAAVNLTVTLLPGPEYTLLDPLAELKELPPRGEEQVVLRVRTLKDQDTEQFRARFIVTYDDPRGPNQHEHFADIVQLISEPAQFQYIPNPYVAGTPLEAGSALFFGREDLLAVIQENLESAHRNNLVFIGQRRMGKTSLLKQLRLRLSPDYIPVYLDGQVIGLDPGMANFFHNLATEITFALEDRGVPVVQPALEDFESSPAGFFERQFLPKAIQAVSPCCHLLILFDEFEELERAVQSGHLDASIFGYLRHLMQHVPQLSFIFCGTHRLEELTSDYWNVLFNISLYQRVSYLPEKEALRLVQEPVEGFGMRYDDLALDKMWRVTAGHPYFLQLLCHSLVNWHNKTRRNYVTIADVNAALEDILSAGEAHFIYLWTESNPDERKVLAVMSRTVPLTGSIQVLQIVDYLAERGVQVDRKAVQEALYRLVLRDILTVEAAESAGEGVFRWQLGLLGLWVEKHKSLGRVLDEMVA